MKGSQKTKLYMVIAILVILLAAAVTGVIWISLHNEQKNIPKTRGMSIQKDVIDMNEGETAEEPEEIQFPGYPDITISAEADHIPIILTNPKGNPCYFKFQIKVKETGQDILESELIEPGKAIDGIDLEKTPEIGKYTLMIQISTYSLEDQSMMNGATVQAVLNVESSK